MGSVSKVSVTRGDVGRQENNSSGGERRRNEPNDFAAICLECTGFVLCGRTGGWCVRPTSADFSPFPPPPRFTFLYLLPALFIPLRPHAAQLAGVAVRLQSQPIPPPPLPGPPVQSIPPNIERRRQVTGVGDGANSSPFQFFIGVIWPSSSMMEGKGGCPFDF